MEDQIVALIVFSSLIIFVVSKITKSIKEFGSFDALFSHQYLMCRDAFVSYKLNVVVQDFLYERYVEVFLASKVVSLSENENLIPAFVNTRTLLLKRPDLVKKYFSKDCFKYTDFLELNKKLKTTVYNKYDEEALDKVKEKILFYNEKGSKHMAQRLFGILLKEGVFSAKNKDERIAHWTSFTGIEGKPEPFFLKNPFGIKDTDGETFEQQKKELLYFIDSL